MIKTILKIIILIILITLITLTLKRLVFFKVVFSGGPIKKRIMVPLIKP